MDEFNVLDPGRITVLRWPKLSFIGLKKRRPIFLLEKPWSYCWEYVGSTRCITIDAPMQTDLGSVPTLFWSFIAPTDLAIAAIPHDKLYGSAGYISGDVFTVNGTPTFTRWIRRDVDRLFAKLMRECGVPAWKRRSAYLAVRAAGWRRWRAAEREIRRRENAKG